MLGGNSKAQIQNSNLSVSSFCHELHKFSRIEFVLIRIIRGRKTTTKKIPNPNRKIGIWNFLILEFLFNQPN